MIELKLKNFTALQMECGHIRYENLLLQSCLSLPFGRRCMSRKAFLAKDAGCEVMFLTCVQEMLTLSLG
jgi:hypothetical protein